MTLNWKYCECGCHQHELTIGARHWTTYNDLKGAERFAEGHNARDPRIGKKMTRQEMQKEVESTLLADLGAICQVFDKRVTLIFKYDEKSPGVEVRKHFDVPEALQKYIAGLPVELRDSPFTKAYEELLKQLKLGEPKG